MRELHKFTIKGAWNIKNPIKNGLDTSRLVNLIICFNSPKDFKMKGFPFPPNLFFIHEISFSEAVGILINKFNFLKKDAISKVKEWRKEVGTNEIKRDKTSEHYELVVEEINRLVVKDKGDRYKIGENDVMIIAGFMKEGINMVHVKDKGFEETCKRLKMNVIPTPKEELEKERKK
jgi:hypothetical protein